MSLDKICHVVETFAKAEWTAHTGLLRRGIDSYFPYTLGDRRHGRWTQASIRPQFPGYLFVTLDVGGSIEPVLRTVGVRDVMRNGVNVIAFPHSLLEDIQMQCGARYRETVPKRADMAAWKVGDVVPVPHGPLAGRPVRINSIDIDKSGRGRVCASIGSLNVTFHIEAEVQAAVPRMAARG